MRGKRDDQQRYYPKPEWMRNHNQFSNARQNHKAADDVGKTCATGNPSSDPPTAERADDPRYSHTR